MPTLGTLHSLMWKKSSMCTWLFSIKMRISGGYRFDSVIWHVLSLMRLQGEAIAVNLRDMFGLRVPIITTVIGEGGSGGALAIGCCDKMLMLENAVYYVARYKVPPLLTTLCFLRWSRLQFYGIEMWVVWNFWLLISWLDAQTLILQLLQYELLVQCPTSWQLWTSVYSLEERPICRLMGFEAILADFVCTVFRSDLHCYMCRLLQQHFNEVNGNWVGAGECWMMQPWSLCCHSLENSCSSSPGVFQFPNLTFLIFVLWNCLQLKSDQCNFSSRSVRHC